MSYPEWFVIANAARARVLERGKGQPLQLVRDFTHPQSRLSAGRLGAAAGGHRTGGSGLGGAAPLPRSDPHRREHQRFAAELAHYLEEQARLRRYGALTVFAPNPFLGTLKLEFGRHTEARLHGALDHDLSHVGLVELHGRIQLALEP